jgi:hypothetical protein
MRLTTAFTSTNSLLLQSTGEEEMKHVEAHFYVLHEERCHAKFGLNHILCWQVSAGRSALFSAGRSALFVAVIVCFMFH